MARSRTRRRPQRVTTEELDEPGVYWRSGFVCGVTVASFGIWAAASGLLDTCWRWIFGG